MLSSKPTILFVTDLYCKAAGRVYSAEDIFLTSQLREDFNLIICHPKDTEPFETLVDGIICRNTGPVMYYQNEYEAFRKRLLANNSVVYNSLTGRADMLGKQYLVDLSRSGFPVIPTIDAEEDIGLLPDAESYVVKLKNGADSIGMRLVQPNELEHIEFDNILIQPQINIRYEVSFYYIDNEIQYALYAPDQRKRWQLEAYDYSPEDLAFAQRFIEWNPLEYGIQRVDACRSEDGELLLVELEDLNPFLSLLDIDKDVCQQFIKNFKRSLRKRL